MKKALIYDRLSDAPKPTNPSPEKLAEIAREKAEATHREQRCREYCKFEGLTVAAVMFDDGVSGRKVPFAQRPQGAACLEALAEQKIRHLVAYRLDRLFRNTADGLLTLDWLAKSNVALHLANEGGQTLNTATAVGKLFVTTRLMVAEFEAALIGERTRDADKRHQANGRIVGGVPYGFRKDPQNGKRFVPDEGEQALIREILERSATTSARALAVELNKEHKFGRKGRKWHHELIGRIVRKNRTIEVEPG